MKLNDMHDRKYRNAFAILLQKLHFRSILTNTHAQKTKTKKKHTQKHATSV